MIGGADHYDLAVIGSRVVSLLDDDRFQDDSEPRKFTESDRKIAKTAMELGTTKKLRRLYWHTDNCTCPTCEEDRTK